jgi:hypothetical protein
MSQRRRSRAGEGAQSVVETALVLPFLLVLVLGFAGAILALDAITELRAATGLATSSAFSAPYGATGQALHNISDTFQRSVHGAFFVPGSLRITCPPSDGNQYLYSSTYQPNTVVSCHGSATLSFSNSLIGLVWQWNVTLQQDAQLAVPPFRQCATGVTC